MANMLTFGVSLTDCDYSSVFGVADVNSVVIFRQELMLFAVC